MSSTMNKYTILSDKLYRNKGKPENIHHVLIGAETPKPDRNKRSLFQNEHEDKTFKKCFGITPCHEKRS